MSDFEKRLVISHGVGSIDSFIMQFVMQFIMEKQKVDQYDNFQNEIGADLYEKLLGLKGNPHLKLDNDRFEEQCFEIRF